VDDGEEVGSLQPTCWFCGEPELLEICDIWTDHNLTLNTCCAGLLEEVAAEMQHDPEWARDLLRRLGAEALTGQRLRRVCDGEGGTPMLDYKLQVRPVTFRDVCAFVRRHHAHNAPPVFIWTTCISTGAPGSVGVPCGQMERSNGKIWDPARGRHRRISRRSG